MTGETVDGGGATRRLAAFASAIGVEVVSDAGMTRYGSRVRSSAADGRFEERTITDPRGSSPLPLPWDDVTEKFCRLVHSTAEESDQRRVIDAVANIEKTDVPALMETLRTAVAACRDTNSKPLPACSPRRRRRGR
jgi:2-methylcitrate dehydratase PrpD